VAKEQLYDILMYGVTRVVAHFSGPPPKLFPFELADRVADKILQLDLSEQHILICIAARRCRTRRDIN
jgi:hypothetical protein